MKTDFGTTSNTLPMDEKAASRKYIHPGTIELALRKSIEDSPRQGILPIRVAMLAAKIHGNDWFSIADVARKLVGDKEEYRSRDCARRMENLGLAEAREHREGNQRIFQARLKVQLFDADHPHGDSSRKLAVNMDHYYDAKPRASALPALLLVATYKEGLIHSKQLRKFCEPQHSFDYESAATSKILREISDSGLLIIIRDDHRVSGAFLAIPVTR
jgi:hypothetical protein